MLTRQSERRVDDSRRDLSAGSTGGGYDDLLPPYEPIFTLAPKPNLRCTEIPVTTAPRPPGAAAGRGYRAWLPGVATGRMAVRRATLRPAKEPSRLRRMTGAFEQTFG
jgi:hypothetical protein